MGRTTPSNSKVHDKRLIFGVLITVALVKAKSGGVIGADYYDEALDVGLYRNRNCNFNDEDATPGAPGRETDVD